MSCLWSGASHDRRVRRQVRRGAAARQGVLPACACAALAAIYKALGDPTRVQILHILTSTTEPVCVCDFTAAFELGQPTISHHLATLREAGIVTSFKRGIWAFYRLNPAMSAAARAAVAQVG
jgi:ArsR family transcriptional regulator, arsenate/arsenite/antimonite-responsive transcriptional repressor